MLHASAQSPSELPVLLLRLSPRPALAAEYRQALRDGGFDLMECTTPEAVQDMMRAGGRVGLLVVEHDSELARLERYEYAVSDSRMCWVALVDEGLVCQPRMREFIAEHLFNFITLPADPAHITLALRHAWSMAFVRDAGIALAAPEADEGDPALLGSTPQMQQLRSQILRIARTDAPVLICGPAGSGKELVAREIHRQSARVQAPFIAVNCGTIPPHRFEGQLFDYVQGKGQTASAHGGTLFLDAVGELGPQAQAGLLRFLGECKAGASAADSALPERSAVRVIAANQGDLAEAVRDGGFRDDLYYRLNVMSLTTPHLANREPDIEAIARHYFTRFARTNNRSLRGFSKAATNAMLAHSWPGNVRELINRVQRATAMAEGRFIQPEDLGLERAPSQAQLLSLEEARAAAERAMIRRALAQSRNQISRAAALLGISRVTLYRLLEKYNIRTETAALVRTSLLSPRTRDNDARN